MDILLLDFDGVINTYDITRRDVDCVMIGGQSTMDLYTEGMAHNVERLCQRYDLSIVISSSWREYYTLNELESMLRYMGITARLIGITPIDRFDHGYRDRQLDDINAVSYDRGMQISHWISTEGVAIGVDRYVVLDDNIYAQYGHETCFIHCDRDIGFDDHTYEASLLICDRVFGIDK